MSGIPKAQIGDKYGYLTIIADTGKRTSQGDVIWKFRCDCGNVINRRFDTIMQSLVGGYIISCGCKISKAIGKREADNPIRKERSLEAICPIDGTTMQGIGEQKIRKNNSSGIRGVSFDKKRGYWRARLTFARKEYSGQFKTKEQAVEYRKYLEEKYYEPIKEKYKELTNERISRS